MQNWQRQERSTALRYGGKVNSGSGNGWVRKNDVRTSVESIECKTTASPSMTLKYVDLWKASKNAIIDGRRMVFAINFERRGRFVVLEESDYLELRNGAAPAPAVPG